MLLLSRLLAFAYGPSEKVMLKDFAIKYATRPGLRVLDVGGSRAHIGRKSLSLPSPRAIFQGRGANYTSLDIEAHPSVDIVMMPGEQFPIADGAFDLVVSSSTFEHDPMFWLTIREMARVTKLQGLIFVNAPSAGQHHNAPGDNWRFYRDAPAALAYWAGKSFDGAPAYPLEVVSQAFSNMPQVEWHMNGMTFRRVDRPSPHFTMFQLEEAQKKRR